jgi:hypothetical protein
MHFCGILLANVPWTLTYRLLPESQKKWTSLVVPERQIDFSGSGGMSNFMGKIHTDMILCSLNNQIVIFWHVGRWSAFHLLGGSGKL